MNRQPRAVLHAQDDGNLMRPNNTYKPLWNVSTLVRVAKAALHDHQTIQQAHDISSFTQYTSADRQVLYPPSSVKHVEALAITATSMADKRMSTALNRTSATLYERNTAYCTTIQTQMNDILIRQPNIIYVYYSADDGQSDVLPLNEIAIAHDVAEDTFCINALLMPVGAQRRRALIRDVAIHNFAVAVNNLLPELNAAVTRATA